MGFVYVITRVGGKFVINFTSCGENGNFAILATTGIYPKISILYMLSQINAIAYFFTMTQHKILK